MTAAVLDRPGSLFDDAARRAFDDDAARPAAEGRPFGRGRVSLEERLDAVLHGTRTSGGVECPVCDARMTYTRAGAECGGCGSRLS